MSKINLLNMFTVTAALLLGACSSSGNNDAAGTSEFNPDLNIAVNTGEPGGDITTIAGLWDGTTSDGNDVVYWYFATNGVLTRYDYQQDSGSAASGENCYVVGDPITVTPESGNDYSIFDVAVTAVVTDESLNIMFLEADKNDLDEDGDTDETPVLTWTRLNTPVLEDLNNCTPTTDNSDPHNSDPQNSADGSLQPTYFNGNINGEDKTGDGITFSRLTESSLHIRGLWGRSQSHFQVDIVLNQTADGTYRLDGNAASGEISEIIGQDAVAATYSASGAEADTVTIVWDQEAGRINGSFAFNAVGTDSNLVVSGEFNNQVSESQVWDCNFDEEFISRCWFVE